METKPQKKLHYYMRSLHRDIGFIVIGLTLIYALSGIVLVFRDTDFLKSEKQYEKQLATQLNEKELGKELQMRRFKVTKQEGDILYFNDGNYNSATGLAKFSRKELPSFVDKLNHFHKSSSKDATHWFSVIYGILLSFLAISSFWMFKPKSQKFKRGIVLSIVGAVATVVLLLL